MEFADVLKARFSCRRFNDQEVAPGEIMKMVALAQRVPSWGNTQPWKVYAAGGQIAKDIRRDLVQAHNSKQPENPDIPMPPKFEGMLMDRYRELGIALFEILGIGRHDKEKRHAHGANNFDAFGAPALVYVTAPKGETPYVVLDAGAFTTAFCLAASEAGLATVVLAALARYPDQVRRHLSIGQQENILIGIALGYADTDVEVNRFRSKRAPLDEVLTLSGF